MARVSEQTLLLPMVSHCLKVLEVLCWSETEMTVSKIADRLDVSKSTAHHVLQVMKTHKFVIQKPRGAYRVGPKLLSLGSAVLRRTFDNARVEPAMDEIAAATQETVIFAVTCPECPGLLVISERETPDPMRLQSYLGKCISEDFFGIKLDNVDAVIREAMPASDFTTSHEDERIQCISSIVSDNKKGVTGVLAILAPKDRLNKNKIKEYSTLCQEKALTLGAAVGKFE